jgi:hypothetical protein
MTEIGPPKVGGFAGGAYTLSEIPERMVRLYCLPCHRWAQFKRSTLLAKYGPDRAMPTLLRLLKPCAIGNDDHGPQCQLVYWDRMSPERRVQAIAKRGIPETWSEK